VASIDVLNTRSGFQQTYRPLDNYIAGDGYFILEDGAGNRSYSRVGNLKFDLEGNLLDGNGSFVCGSLTTLGTDPATVEKIKITDFENYTGMAIGPDGKITGVDTASGTIKDLGQIGLAYFTNAEGLSQEGNMYFKETPNSGEPKFAAPGSDFAGTLVAGGLELSNVDLSKEFTDMIIAQRGFQANSRVITTSDEILQELVNLKR
jgi:flagellar hook protein FlgE